MGFLRRDFRNESARQYYLDEIIGEITAEADSGLSLVFFDGGLGMLAENPHPSPSGLVGGSGNCSISYNASHTGGKDLNFTDVDRMESIRAGLTLLVEAAKKLNEANLIPIYSMAVPFDPIVAAHRGYPGLISEGTTAVRNVDSSAAQCLLSSFLYVQAKPSQKPKQSKSSRT